MGKTLVPRMHSLFVEDGKEGRKAYKSLLLEPSKLSVLNSEIAVEIVRELTRQPSCALDIARSLQKDEQKIYYYLRKLEASGIVRLAGMERRHGMTAKIYEAIAPVISTKLNDGGENINFGMPDYNPKLSKFLSPFIENGKLNSRIILADPYPHGKYDSGCKSGVHIFDFAMLLGKLSNSANFPSYSLDTEIDEDNLKENLILFSNPQVNIIVDRINPELPVFFDADNGWALTSKVTGRKYDDPRIGLIAKFDNPFDVSKKILLLAGMRTRGMRAAIVAITKHIDEVMEGVNSDGNLARVVEGLDRGGRKVIDSVKFLE